MEATANNDNIFKNAHAKAFGDIKDNIPELEIMEIIETVIALYKGKITPAEAAKQYAAKYKDSFSEYLKIFSTFVVKEGIGKLNSPELDKLNDENLADRLVSSGEKLSIAMKKYLNGEIDDKILFTTLGDSGMKEITVDIMGAYGIDLNALNGMSLDDIYKVSLPVMSCLAFTKSFEILQSALNDEKIAYDRRIAIEAECEESIALIHQYRQEMNEKVSEYLSDRMETFDQGFRKMDQALMENDVDGYLSGNQQIREILGYKAQFSNMDEFDDLMMSDISFKL